MGGVQSRCAKPVGLYRLSSSVLPPTSLPPPLPTPPYIHTHFAATEVASEDTEGGLREREREQDCKGSDKIIEDEKETVVLAGRFKNSDSS